MVYGNIYTLAFGNQDVASLLPIDVSSDSAPDSYYRHVADLYKQAGWPPGVVAYIKKAINVASPGIDNHQLSLLWQTVFTSSTAISSFDEAFMAITCIPKINMYGIVYTLIYLVGEIVSECLSLRWLIKASFQPCAVGNTPLPGLKMKSSLH